jgi:hypothetical protein
MLEAALAAPAPDWLAAALCAAELGEPFDLDAAPPRLAQELFAAAPELRVSVPYAALRLLSRFATDARADVRAGVARALPWFAELYPSAVEQQLLLLACDSAHKVRDATAYALADLIETADDPEALVERWQGHPNRARDVLARARARLLSPLRTR